MLPTVFNLIIRITVANRSEMFCSLVRLPRLSELDLSTARPYNVYIKIANLPLQRMSQGIHAVVALGYSSYKRPQSNMAISYAR